MKKLSILGLFVLVLALPTSSIFAASTANVLGSGVCINEILIDPTGTNNFDTDNNGTPNDEDEFVELYNLSAVDIDISGWQLWDAGVHNWFTFPGTPDDGTTVLKAGAYAVVVVGVQSGGSLPVMTNPDSLVFDAATSSLLNNLGDNVVLYDAGADEYIQLLFNGDAADNPPIHYVGDGFSATALRVGSIEDYGSDTDGKSLTRYPSGDTNVVVHDSIPGVTSFASPTKVTVHRLRVSGLSHTLPGFAVICLITALASLKHK